MGGQVKADSRLSELEQSSTVILVMQERVGNVPQVLRTLNGVTKVEEAQTAGGYSSYRIKADSKTDLSSSVFKLAAEQKWPVRELRHDVRTLEMVFNELAMAE